jgi:signal transduction histidine kinase
MSAEIGAGDAADQFDTLHAEAKAALAYAANTLRTVAGRYREAFHADLAGWHEDRDALDNAGGANGTAAELERRIALAMSDLGERQAELARLELAVRGLERTWLFLERGDASLLADPGAPELADDLQMRIVEAREAERTRLAQEIHDGPAQALSNAIFGVEYIEKTLDRDLPTARVELRFLRERLRRELGDVRAFISQLRPPILDEVGLDGAIRDAAATLHALSGAAVEVNLGASPDDLGDAEQVVVLRVLQEALQNEARWILEVRDDGRGFDPDAPAAPGRRTFGLQFMRERAELVRAEFTVRSRPANGTVVTLDVPVPERGGSA